MATQYIRVLLGLYRDNGKENGNYVWTSRRELDLRKLSKSVHGNSLAVLPSAGLCSNFEFYHETPLTL